jgi:predicted acylesterase/phospholipase RssA
MSTPRVAMVLSGGGAKAAAHIGAARAMRDAGVVPVHWVATSMGAPVAAMLASGEDPDRILERFLAVKRNDVLVPRRMVMLRGFWTRALFRAQPFRDTIARLVPARTFDELRAPLTVTAVEELTGVEVAFGAGGESAPLIDALCAACALPPYFPPAMVNGRSFYDGGLRATVPLRQAEAIDCDVVVAIHVAPGFDELGPPVQVPPPLIAATDTAMGWLMAGTSELMRAQWSQRPGAQRLVWLRPVSDRGATFALERAGGYAEAGYTAMSAALREL